MRTTCILAEHDQLVSTRTSKTSNSFSGVPHPAWNLPPQLLLPIACRSPLLSMRRSAIGIVELRSENSREVYYIDNVCRSDGLILWIEEFADGMVAQSDIFVQVKELEDESRNQMEQREKEEAEEGPLATILGTMKRTITNADGLRFVTA